MACYWSIFRTPNGRIGQFFYRTIFFSFIISFAEEYNFLIFSPLDGHFDHFQFGAIKA